MRDVSNKQPSPYLDSFIDIITQPSCILVNVRPITAEDGDVMC